MATYIITPDELKSDGIQCNKDGVYSVYKYSKPVENHNLNKYRSVICIEDKVVCFRTHKRIPYATFCVFSNRFLAIIISAAVCLIKHRSLSSAAPLISFTPCAVSNTLSSWAQYQALSYVGFSLQTIFKSTKILPAMLMGYILKKTKYNFIDYFEAFGITFGVLIFSFSNDNQATTISAEVVGILLLSLYVLSDSFTAQWQSTIYRDYGKIDQFQMMFGVNLSAIIITSL